MDQPEPVDPVPPDPLVYKCCDIQLGKFTAEEATQFEVLKFYDQADRNLVSRMMPTLRNTLETSGFSPDFMDRRFWIGAAEALGNAGSYGLANSPVIISLYILPRATERICFLTVLNFLSPATTPPIPKPDEVKPVEEDVMATHGRGMDLMRRSSDVCKIEIEPGRLVEITLIWIESN